MGKSFLNRSENLCVVGERIQPRNGKKLAFTSACALGSRLYHSNDVVCESAEAPSLRVSFSLSRSCASGGTVSHPHLSPSLSGAFQLDRPLSLEASPGEPFLIHHFTRRTAENTSKQKQMYFFPRIERKLKKKKECCLCLPS